jgi:hypothetical protein
VEDALSFIESELITDLRIHHFNSSLELNSRSFTTPFNIPKNQKSQGLTSGEWSAVIVKHDTSRILMPLLIHCGTLNCTYVPKTSPAAADDENSRFPFSNRGKCNRENIAG